MEWAMTERAMTGPRLERMLATCNREAEAGTPRAHVLSALGDLTCRDNRDAPSPCCRRPRECPHFRDREVEASSDVCSRART